MIQDLMAALVANLRAAPAISALAGTRVYGLELPAAEAPHMPRHVVVLSPSGGVDSALTHSLPLESQRVDVRCYGATGLEAVRLRRVVRHHLRGLVRVRQGTVLIHSAVPAGGLAEDVTERWPYAWESWSVLASEIAA